MLAFVNINAPVYAAPFADVQPSQSPQDDHGWFLIYADRRHMAAINADFVRDTPTAATVLMAAVDPGAAPDQANLVLSKVVFDCFSDRFQLNQSYSQRFGSADVRSADHLSGWVDVPAGTDLAKARDWACKGRQPQEWPDSHMSISLLVRFYYETVLGRPAPLAVSTANGRTPGAP
jgi:hypothetical protein